jgi:gliding motility-associated-like protein
MTVIGKTRRETKKKRLNNAVKVLVLRKTSSFRGMKIKPVNLLLTTLLGALTGWAQPSNDNCNLAVPLCPSVSVSGTNQGATRTVCPGCADDFTLCFTTRNSVWFTFTTNGTGGDVSVDFSNLNFTIQPTRGTELQAAIIRAIAPCDGTTYTGIGNCVAGASANFTLTATGLPANSTYYVVVNGALNGGATLPAEATFDVIASGTGIDRLPAGLSITGPAGTLCPQAATTFNANVSNCTDTSDFTWYLNGEIVAITPEALWQTSEIQDGDVVTLECSCFTDCPQAMTAQYGPLSVENLFVNAGPDQVIPSGSSTVLLGTTNGITYYWTPANSLSSPTSLQTVAIPASTTTYFLTASSALCSLSDDVTISISDQFVIPGSFSPNGDGTNDTWAIKGVDFYPNAHVLIYDRWGQEILDVVGYSAAKAWDGTHNGRDVTDGVFYYVVDLRDSQYKEPFKGFVTVIR